MRVGILQLNPELGEIENNLNQAEKILKSSSIKPKARRLYSRSTSTPSRARSIATDSQVRSISQDRGAQGKQLDLLVAPELAFSGNYANASANASTNAEPTLSGRTSMWARRMTLEYGFIVTAGYPERDKIGDKCYNSAVTTFSKGGKLEVINYRQTQLDCMSKKWATPGTGFWNGEIPDLGKVTIGIGWDIMETPLFTDHIIKNESNLVIIPVNFIINKNLIRYMCQLLWLVAFAERETIVVIANRSGTQGGYTYAGSSAVLSLGSGFAKIYKALGRDECSLLIADTSGDPAYTWDEDMVFPHARRITTLEQGAAAVADIVGVMVARENAYSTIFKCINHLSLKEIIKGLLNHGVPDSILSKLVEKERYIGMLEVASGELRELDRGLLGPLKVLDQLTKEKK